MQSTGKWIIAVMLGLGALSAPASEIAAVTPAHRMEQEWWKARHEARVVEAAAGEYDVVFIGDSITQGWERAGKASWDRHYAGRKALNLGFSGDRTEHVLWRLDNGEFPKSAPRLIVMMLGTNNTGHRKDPPEQTAEGMRLILERLRDLAPDAKVLLLAVFPRDETSAGELRVINDGVNKILRTFADGDRVTFLDINSKLLEPNGTLSREIMPDLLHPKEKGYQIWAEAMEPFIARILGDAPAP